MTGAPASRSGCQPSASAASSTASSLSGIPSALPICEKLRSPLPVCPYDQRSPDYATAPNDKPCIVCGTENKIGAPDLCRGADTRCMGEAADIIEELYEALAKARLLISDGPRPTSMTGMIRATVDAALAKARGEQ